MAEKHGTAQQAYDEGLRDGRSHAAARIAELAAALERFVFAGELYASRADPQLGVIEMEMGRDAIINGRALLGPRVQ